MARETILNKNELKARTRAEFMSRTWKMGNPAALDFTNQNTWSTEWKHAYSITKAGVYAKMRAELKQKKAVFWTKLMDNGNIEVLLERHGIMLRNGHTRFKDNGMMMLKYYLENIVIPEIENEIGVYGIAPIKNRSPYAHNILSFENAHLKQD